MSYILSLPLPADHWLYAPWEYEGNNIDPIELPAPILSFADIATVTEAIRYAIRAATSCGTEEDFDPDALVLNAVYALCRQVRKECNLKQEPLGEDFTKILDDNRDDLYE